jgi:hypothetical protein
MTRGLAGCEQVAICAACVTLMPSERPAGTKRSAGASLAKGSPVNPNLAQALARWLPAPTLSPFFGGCNLVSQDYVGRPEPAASGDLQLLSGLPAATLGGGGARACEELTKGVFSGAAAPFPFGRRRRRLNGDGAMAEAGS